MVHRLLIFISLMLLTQCQGNSQSIEVGAQQSSKYLPILKGKKVGVVCNQTSLVEDTHIVDFLVANGINIQYIFAPEHGFRGSADAGASVASGKDIKTGIPIVSLYGSSKKPSSEVMKKLDFIIYDIQDVGARFYTYISTLEYVMESCAENKVPILVLDRPNPNGDYIDGPILQKAFKSFVGMQPIPIVYGMTVAEYAQMLIGEGWIHTKERPKLYLVKCQNYTHDMNYSLPVAPSPNLRSDQSIRLYPSLCLFEGADVSVGRGTETPFEVFGSPNLSANDYPYSFTPISSYGSKHPPFENKVCHGENLHDIQSKRELDLSYIVNAYKNWKGDKSNFFLANHFIDKLWGSSELRTQIQNGYTEEQIRESWQEDLDKFKAIRIKYLLYPDFTP